MPEKVDNVKEKLKSQSIVKEYILNTKPVDSHITSLKWLIYILIIFL